MTGKTITDCFVILSERKRFLRRLSVTEINRGEHPYLYFEIMEKLLGVHDCMMLLRSELAPIIRVARSGKIFKCGSFVQNGRFVSSLYVHHVYIFASVDLKEFVRFILLTEGVSLYNLKPALSEFIIGLYNELLSLNTHPVKRDFLLDYLISNEDIRVRVAKAISRYMELKTKKILRLKKPNSIINNYYGR